MRSDLVFGATAQVPNRYRLCRLATKATRKLHRPYTRLQDTINGVLIRFREADPETEADEEKSAAHGVAWRNRPAVDFGAELQPNFQQMESRGDLHPLPIDGLSNGVELR
jgi:hypothetical protein